MFKRAARLLLPLAFLALIPAARAADWVVPRSTVPAPQDRAFSGVVQLQVDATDLRRRIIRVSQRVPVQGTGLFTLLYPRWEAGSHGPTTEVQRLAGLTIRAGGQRLAWQRDPLDPHAFQVRVPRGASHLEIDFQYLAPLGTTSLISQDMVNLQWQHVLVYPAGWFASRMTFAPTLRLPEGFAIGTSLRERQRAGRDVEFEPVTLDALLDAPVIAAPQVQRRPLIDGDVPIRVTYFASKPEQLAQAASMDGPLRAVLQQVGAVMGRPPFPAFDFLVPLSDRLPGPGGLEHAHSAEITLPPDFLPNPAAAVPFVDLFAHEYVHAWNGKHVQPAEHWTPTPNIPMQNGLLWVVEGQTEFWGRVIGARAGLRTVQDTLDALAIDAAAMANRSGRRWKSLGDSALDPVTMPGGRGVNWQDWQRRKDYYAEGVLLWLDIDGLLREHSQGRHGMDDFAAAFFRVKGPAVRRYGFDDVCRTLSSLARFDWRGYLRQRVDGVGDLGLLDGLERAGYRLTYTDTPSAYFRQAEESDGVPDFNYSIGLAISSKGVVRSVKWEGAAFQAGLVPGARITQVAGEPFSAERLAAAVAARRESGIELKIEFEGQAESVTLRYGGGMRYPTLTRMPDRPDRLLQLLAPRQAVASR